MGEMGEGERGELGRVGTSTCIVFARINFTVIFDQNGNPRISTNSSH